MKRREPKKSETLEVRLPHEVKMALMEKARTEGHSASAVVRQFIDAYLSDQRKEARTMLSYAWKPAAAVGAAALVALWTTLAPSPATAGPDLKSAFEQLDRNRNGSIALDEFLGRSPGSLFAVKTDPPATGGRAKPFVLPLRKEVPAPAPGTAQPDPQFLSSEFSRQDLDRDGSVTFAEFERFHLDMLRSGFAGIDLDHDGTLDRAEFDAAVQAAPDAQAAASFEDIDANGDGRISEAEFFG
jgi:hypothetical protein